MGHDDPHGSHRTELYARSAAFLDELLALDIDDEREDAVIAAFTVAAVEIYAIARRHAICELIRLRLGPEHPMPGLSYVLNVALALSDEEHTAAQTVLRTLTDVDGALGIPEDPPAASDLLN